MIASVNWQYIILQWPSNGVYRVKKRADGPPPVPDTGIDAVNNDFWSKTAPPDRMFNNDKYVFAFWSITAQDMLSSQREAHLGFGRTASSSHPGSVVMGGGLWIISAKAYYVRDIGIGGGNHGVFIDAFDVQAGDFIADDFVDVSPDDAARTLTTAANNGYIDTTAQIAAGSTIKITARHILPSGLAFANWQEVPSLLISFNPAMPATIGAPDIHDIVAHSNDIIYAFAFYNELPLTLRPVRHYEMYDPWWWIRTHGGLTPPLPDPQPWMPQYDAVLVLANAAEKVSPKLRSDVLQIALQQLSIISASVKNEIRKGK
jgi:hypothetical protein